MKKILFIALFYSLSYTFAQGNLPFQEFKFGDGTEAYKSTSKEISSYNNGQEVYYEYLKKIDVLETYPSSVELRFYSNRLHTVNFSYTATEFEKLKQGLIQKYGKSWAYAANSNSWNWDLKEVKIRASKVEENYFVEFYDESQKDFHFTDLFKGMVLWVMIVIVGMFVVYLFISWLFSSYCVKCKTFNVKFQEISLENPVDYSYMDGHQILYQAPETIYDKVFKFKCNKCGNTRNERYSSWWSWYNKHKTDKY